MRMDTEKLKKQRAAERQRVRWARNAAGMKAALERFCAPLERLLDDLDGLVERRNREIERKTREIAAGRVDGQWYQGQRLRLGGCGRRSAYRGGWEK